MPRRLMITIVCFHISAAILAFVGVAVIPVVLVMHRGFGMMAHDLSRDQQLGQVFPVMGAFMWAWMLGAIAFLIGMAVFIEIVVRGLNQRRYWAWIVGLVICGLMILNGLHSVGLGVVLGGLSLWGLVDPETVAAFKPQSQPPDNLPQP